MKEFIVFMIFVSLCFIFYITIQVMRYRTKSINRINKYIKESVNVDELGRTRTSLSKNVFYYISKIFKNFKILGSYFEKTQNNLIKANLPLKAEEYLNIKLILFILCAVIPFATGKNIPIIIITAILGWFLPDLYLRTRIKKRLKQFNEGLSDTIGLISNSLKAGFSFFQAIDIVAKEMQGPIAQEFEFLQKEIALGCTTEQALENMLTRIKSGDLELVVTSVLIQRQVGGNLAEILDNISFTIRERVRIKGEIRAITAQGRMSGIVIAILPPALGLIIFLVNPEHISLLFSNTVGLVMLGVSVLMELMGIYFIKKIVDIDI